MTRKIIAVYVFDLSYSATNVMANREMRVPAVKAFLAAHTRPDDRILSSALVATDLPNRTFAFYRVVADSSTLLSTI